MLPGSSVGIGILSDRSFDSLKDSISEPTMKVCLYDLLYIHHSFCNVNMVRWGGGTFVHFHAAIALFWIQATFIDIF